MSQSTLNSFIGTIPAGSSFTGRPEVFNGSISIVCFLNNLVDLTITVYQSPDGVTYYLTDTYNASVSTYGPQSRVQFYTKGIKGYIVLTNSGAVDATSTVLRTLLTPNNHDGTRVQPSYVILEGSTVPVDISGNVVVSNFPAVQAVSGINSNFVFTPTVENNTATIYADETKGVDVLGGWQYANLDGVGKINWYCYASPSSATDYKVSQLNSMYAVVNQQSTLGLAVAQNPFIIFYTRPTSTATTFYQNKFFYGSNAGTDTTGVKLLYTGADPVGIHPEIVAPNRIQLEFKPLLSTSTPALSQNESIYLGSLQTTDNTTPANSFSFTMQEFGIDWVKTPAILPIEFNSVVVSGSVGLTASLNTATYNQAVSASSFTGTPYDMGQNSLVDVLLLASGLITTGVIRLDYSIDGINWFPNNTTTYAITSTDPHQTIIGLKTGSRFIRVSSGVASLFRATNLQMVFSSKRD
jgi:hypothetical protein